MDNNINFTGSFVIQKPGKIRWNKIIKEMIPESSFIKGNFLGKGNMFVAASDRYDREIATYLINGNYVFNYYPNVNMKSGICNLPVPLIEEMVKGSKVISKKKEIAKYAAEVEKRYIPANYVRKENDHMPQTLNALRTVEHIAVDSLKPFTFNGVTIFVDRNGKLVAKASKNNPRGFNFIKVYDRFSDEDMEMIKADYMGNVLYRTKNIDKLRLFNRDFLAAVNSAK